MLKWLAIGVGAVVGILVAAVAVVHVVVGFDLRRKYTIPLAAIAVPDEMSRPGALVIESAPPGAQ